MKILVTVMMMMMTTTTTMTRRRRRNWTFSWLGPHLHSLNEYDVYACRGTSVDTDGMALIKVPCVL